MVEAAAKSDAPDAVEASPKIAVKDLAMLVLASAKPITEKMPIENTRLEVAHV